MKLGNLRIQFHKPDSQVPKFVYITKRSKPSPLIFSLFQMVIRLSSCKELNK